MRDEVRLTDVVRVAERRITRRVERILDGSDVSIDQWRVLRYLADGSGHQMSAVARHAIVPAPSLTKIVDRLVERGLVHRRVDDADRRKVLIFISARGEEVHAAVDAAVRQEELSIIEQVGAGDGARLLAFLGRMAERLDAAV